MIENSTDFQTLLAKMRDGCQESAWQLIEIYGSEMLRVVRRRLPSDLRSKFDSQDFVQAAWASVFAHRSRLLKLQTPPEFVAYMAAVASNKVRMEVRKRLQGQKYNVNRETTLHDSGLNNLGLAGTGAESPSQIAVARERWFQIVGRQPSRNRRILQLRFQGISFQTIADRLAVDERTVRRVIERILREAGSDNLVE